MASANLYTQNTTYTEFLISFSYLYIFLKGLFPFKDSIIAELIGNNTAMIRLHYFALQWWIIVLLHDGFIKVFQNGLRNIFS